MTLSPRPGRLPERLSLAFPLWALHDTPPGGAYHDPERLMTELEERSFNCIRVDDGRGLNRLVDGRLEGRTTLAEPFPGHSRTLRQLWCTGNGGGCDVVERLLALFEAASRHRVWVILSSWYYLHTYWYGGDRARVEELFALPVHERFGYFAELLNELIARLRRAGLARWIAFAEIFNEADGLPFINGYGGVNGLPREELERFREEHTRALACLRRENPDVCFACDTYTPDTDVSQLPSGMEVWNFHSYFLWDLYGLLERRLLQPGTDVSSPAELGPTAQFLRERPYSLEAVRRSRSGRPAAEDWNRRVWLYRNLDPAQLPRLERQLTAELERNFEHYQAKVRQALATVTRLRAEHCPEVALVLGEGGSYCGSTLLRWEERSAAYWELLTFAVREYRKAGLWGCIPRTCCGPEDPCWYDCAEQLKRLNELFQQGEPAPGPTAGAAAARGVRDRKSSTQGDGT